MTGQNSFRQISVFFTLLLLFFSGCANEEKSISTALATARENIEQGNTDKAITILEEINAKYPDQTEILQELAYAYAGNGEPTKAALNFARVAEIDPERRSYLLFAARNLTEAGEARSAVLRYQEYLRHFPDDAGTWQILGELQAEQNLPETAVNSLTKSFELQPKGPIALQLAGLFSKMGNRAQAETWYHEAIKQKDGVEGEALIGLLQIALDKRDYTAARDLSNQLKERYPVTIARSGLAQRLSEIDDWEKKQAELAKALEEQAALTEEFRNPASPSPEPEAEKKETATAEATASAEEQAEQVTSLDTTTSETPTQQTGPKMPGVPLAMSDAVALPAKETVDESKNEEEPAKLQIEVEVAVSPEMAEEVAQEAPGDVVPEQSTEIQQVTLEDAINRIPDKNPTFANLIDQARYQRSQENFTAAAKTYWQALLLDDRPAEIWFELSESLLKDNQLEIAEKTALEALRRDPDSLLYSVNYLRVAQYTLPERQFLQELRKAEEKFPNNVEIMLALARAHRNIQRDYRTAAEKYRKFLETAPNHPQADKVREELKALPSSR